MEAEVVSQVSAIDTGVNDAAGEKVHQIIPFAVLLLQQHVQQQLQQHDVSPNGRPSPQFALFHSLTETSTRNRVPCLSVPAAAIDLLTNVRAHIPRHSDRRILSLITRS
jgi:hypothetical protein